MRSSPFSAAFRDLCSWTSLLEAYRRASRGKRRTRSVAAFDFQAADRILELRDELLAGTYRPGPYTHFFIHEPKRRKISAAQFRDRVVHHALCRVIEPRFERVFLPDSYANRVGKGGHRAVDRLQAFARRYRYALRADIRQHFASIDHAILLRALRNRVPEDDIMALVRLILAGGESVLADEYTMQFFPGDDLFATCRPRGLPIGNLTSQFWSNCYLHPLDLFVKRELGCRAYLRYVDDFALFSDSAPTLWAWKAALRERLALLRLTMHESRAQVTPVAVGIPWLGFVVFADHRLVKARKVRFSARRLRKRYADYRAGALSFAEFDASVGGWINHVRYADTWGLRQHVLQPFALNVGDVPHRTTRLVRRSQMSLMTRPSAPHATAPARRSARTEVQTRSRRSSACHRAGIAANILVTRDVESTLMAEPKLDLLMQMVQRVLDGQKDIREDLREIKARLGRLETDVAQLHVYLAEQSTRLDRFSDRLERVERRLEIVET